MCPFHLIGQIYWNFVVHSSPRIFKKSFAYVEMSPVYLLISCLPILSIAGNVVMKYLVTTVDMFMSPYTSISFYFILDIDNLYLFFPAQKFINFNSQKNIFYITDFSIVFLFSSSLISTLGFIILFVLNLGVVYSFSSFIR